MQAYDCAIIRRKVGLHHEAEPEPEQRFGGVESMCRMRPRLGEVVKLGRYCAQKVGSQLPPFPFSLYNATVILLWK